ncbi:hypothetical protein NPX13_g6984 [Xylaria arbuscula]|uniref:DNA repair protein RAD50 n=1 Tax=Xylaria arbuscula TaxID=114810 RepID=A0A9W8NBJ2_9PEZI|nr:hypothetical protein NPX13_g6984 [Xylaria arbuscula]
MSKIDKLSISGVRSFGAGPAQPAQNIAFFTPLTLIVGYNGSGKTTIIECLKYATTGELPPNSKGGAFVHDPKLCGQQNILAQVKLKYNVPPNTSYVVTRSLQVVLKKNTRSQKTLDATVRIDCDGEKNSISSKEANLNKIVSDTLGVSPAILDAVIFCHQEESLWPMSEPAALKKRFDEIFEAMKYTKAIENLKVIRKRRGEILRDLKTKEIGDKQNKDKGEKCEARSRELEAEISDLREEAAELHAEVIDAEQKAKERRKLANSYLLIDNDLKMKSEELRIRTTTLEESKGRMDEELGESDQRLRDTLAQYEEHVARYEQDLEENKHQYRKYKESLDDSRHQQSEKLAERGKHQSDEAKYKRQLESRVHLVQQAAHLHSIHHLQAQNASEVDNQTTVITNFEGQKSRHTQNRVFAKQRIAACEKNIATLQRELNMVEIDEGAKAILDSESKDLESRFEQTSQDLQNADFGDKLQQEESRLQQLESESSRLGRELVESTRLLSDRAQLEVRKDELMEKTRRLGTLRSTWNEKLSALLGGHWDPATVEKEFHKGLQVKTQAFDDASRKRDDILQQLKTVQANLASIKEQNRRRDAESTRCKSLVVEALRNVDPDADLGVDALPTEIERLESDIVTLKNDMSLSTEMSKYYAGCRKVMEEKNKCELCERPFANANEKSRLAAKIRAVLEQFGKSELEAELKESEQLLSQLRAARPQSETFIRLRAEKVEVAKELQDVETKEARILRSLEEMDDTVRVRQEDRQEFESMNKTVLNISQTHKDIVEAEAQVDRIMSQQQSSGNIRSTQEITELQNECAEQLKVVKNKISQLSNDRQRMRDAFNALELERSELRNKLSHAVRQLERKKDYQDQIQSQKSDIAKQREIIQEADKDLESVEPKISKARTIRDDILQRGREKEKKVATERDGLAGSVSELKMIDNDIQDYLRSGGPSNLSLTEQAIQALDKTIKRTEDDMNALVARANKMKEDMASSDRKKKNIMENLTYRKAARDIDILEQEVVELESRKAEDDYNRFEREANHFDSVRHVKNAERGAVLGAMKSKDEELVKLLKEWKDEYEESAKIYRQTHIEVEAHKAAIEDLGRYGTALNNAIMQYHAMKMEEVNRIAGDLWQNTYQGTDIDTILIRSDSEATSGRSSYNYRVCMVKQDTEMDMRGRCSAGQKVLASIIIRLALAESFGIGCGLIALDEPTTNLDRDNIKSLAESLHSIIKARRAQRNFQLIVITHDEEFLRHMRCSEFCDDFWRVSRDERQQSRIDRESIATIV